MNNFRFNSLLPYLRGIVGTFLIAVLLSFMLDDFILRTFIIVYVTAWIVFLLNRKI